MYQIYFKLLFGFFVFLLFGCASNEIKWNSVSGPTNNPDQVFGSYSAGCLDGAVSLTASSKNYQAMRLSRQRYYGHPRLIQFLNDYSKEVYESGLGSLAIGDLSQARGGPMPQGHASHQTGLDADIWFKRFTDDERKSLSLNDLESFSAIFVVNEDTLTINDETWKEESSLALKAAALHVDVERVFVNFVIKKKLCEIHKGESWLNKIRPWWGHNYHYHVRLSCPKGSATCKPQQPVIQNDGCDETLDWWFTEEAQTELDKKKDIKERIIKLPLQCAAVFNNRSIF